MTRVLLLGCTVLVALTAACGSTTAVTDRPPTPEPDATGAPDETDTAALRAELERRLEILNMVDRRGCPKGMASIDGGTFEMGSNSYNAEKPPHQVTLGPYCLDVTEVTVAAYERCVKHGRCTEPADKSELTWQGYCNWTEPDRLDHPVNCVSWHQAQAYCTWLGKRLPTEAEWEYAARNGAEQRYHPWGKQDASPQLACWDRWSKRSGTCPVGSFPAEPFGLRDMAGNLWEWVADWYGPYPIEPQQDPTGPPQGWRRVYRGGSWCVRDSTYVATARRSHDPPHYQLDLLGFRCAQTRGGG